MVHEIRCPHCGKSFTIDEAGYADIVKQVRDSEFEKSLHERLELAKQEKENALQLAEAKAASELQKAAAAKDAEIVELMAKLDASGVAQELAVKEALTAVEKERDVLANELERGEKGEGAVGRAGRGEARGELQKQASAKDAEIQDLKVKPDAIAVGKELEVTKAVTAVERMRIPA